ncbi:hypothetical protein G9A89_018487 [Geosiphon pyriformis]|nr:hypothetical protein G9A89_018487 [Geosiphon pyriformis]
MHVCHNCGKQEHIRQQSTIRKSISKFRSQISNSKSLPKSRSNYLPTNDGVTNLSTTSISNSSLSNTCNLSTTATSNLSVVTLSNLLTPTTNSNTATKLASKQTPKAENDTTKLAIGNSSPLTDSQFNLGTGATQNLNFQNYLSLLITPEDASANNLESTQKQPLTSNIPSVTITEDKFLTTIFPFKFEKTTATPLFSGAAFEAKPITAIYMDAKVNGQSIKLILDSSSAGSIITQQLIDQLSHQVDYTASARIITANGVTKTPISEIDEFPFEVNDIITPIKVLVMEATQYQALVGNDWLFKTNAVLDWMMQELQLNINTTCGHFKVPLREELLIELEEEEKKPIWEAYQVLWADNDHNKLPLERGKKKKNLPEEQTKDCGVTMAKSWEKKGKGKEQEEEPKQTTSLTHILYATPLQNAYHRPKLVCVSCGKKLSTMSTCCRKDKEWMTATKYYCCPCILECNRQPPKIRKWDGTLCLTCRDTLLDKGMWKDIPGRGGACDETCQYTILINDWCDLIYNPLPCIIYTIPEEEKPISNCISESESPINRDSNSDNDNDNNGSSSIQNSNNNDNDSNSDPNSNTNYKQYIGLPDLSKEQELKWYSDNGKGIMPEHVHDTDAGFNLRYLKKKAIKLEPHLHTCIDLKIVLEILTTTMVQLASRSSLAKREINIRGGIIDVGYIGNIIAMLQNDSEKTYIIEPNKKIAQAIFLSLIRVA